MPESVRTANIVAGCDFSSASELVIAEAARAGQDREQTLHVLHVLDRQRPRLSHARSADLEFEAHERLRALVETGLGAAGVQPRYVQMHVLPGDPATEILRLAENVAADRVVVGTHGRRGFTRLLLGSVAERVMREARCPVLVVRPLLYDAHPELVPEPPCAECTELAAQADGAARLCPVHDHPWATPHRYSYDGALLRPYHPGRRD